MAGFSEKYGEFLVIAILFNPTIPVHLTRQIWLYVDVATGLFSLTSIKILKPGKGKQEWVKSRGKVGMNKKMVVLLVILVLLVLTTVNRWDIRFYSDGRVQVRVDKLTMQTQYTVLSNEGYMTRIKDNKYLVYGTTAFLCSAIAATTVALLLEARKEGD